MHPTLFTWQGLGFHTWGLMITLAFVFAGLVTGARSARVGIDPDKLVPLYLIAPIGGLLGARMLHFAMAEPRTLLEHPLAFFDMGQGGFAFYGGVILAGIAGTAWGRWAGLDPWKLADLAAPPIMLGLALGRIGCFFAGCCHGATCDVAVMNRLVNLQGGSVVSVDGFPFLALVYKAGVGVGAIFDEPLFPTQLWESAGAFMLFGGLSLVWRYGRRFDGIVMGLMLALYAPLRWTVESFRGDTVRGVGYFGVLSTSQVVSIGLGALGIVLLIAGALRGFKPEQPYRDEEDAA